MTTLTAELQKYVTKVTAWMLADKNDAEIMQNVSILSTTPDVNAFQASLVIPSASATLVSTDIQNNIMAFENVKRSNFMNPFFYKFFILLF